MISRFVLLSCFVALLGCSLTSVSQTDVESLTVEIPSSWGQQPLASQGLQDNWLQEMGGENLVGLVEEALANNPDLVAAESRLQQAKAQARIANSADLPKLSAVFQGQRQRQNFVGFPDFGGGGSSVLVNRSNQFRLATDVQWELDLWGRIRAGKRAALAEVEASQADLTAAEMSLAAEVARAWFAVAEALLLEELAQESYATFQETERIVSRRFELGDDRAASSAQVRLARTDVASAEASLHEYGRLTDVAKRRLEILLGRYPSGEVAAAPSLPDVGGRPPAGLPSELLLRRPDILAAERRFVAATQRVEEARKAQFPSLALTSSLGTSTDDLEQLLNSTFGVWSLAAGVTQPIWRGGEIRAHFASRQAAEKQALSQLQKTVLAAFAEVENALAAETWLANQHRSLLQAVNLSEEAFHAAQEDYRQGRGDILTLLQSQRLQLQLRSQLITLNKARLENRIYLHLALGGDFLPS